MDQEQDVKIDSELPHIQQIEGPDHLSASVGIKCETQLVEGDAAPPPPPPSAVTVGDNFTFIKCEPEWDEEQKEEENSRKGEEDTEQGEEGRGVGREETGSALRGVGGEETGSGVVSQRGVEEVTVNVDHQSFVESMPCEIEQTYSCLDCGAIFNAVEALWNHVEEIHSKMPCRVCGKIFARRSHLTEHSKVHSGERPYCCSLCKKTFVRLWDLKKHVKNLHSVDRASHLQKNRFPCSICGRLCSSPAGLREHLTTHTGERAFNCVICGKNFARKSDLNQHTLVHTQDKSFSCDLCSRSFLRKSDLRKHMFVHNKNGPPEPDAHKCSQCGLVCRSRYTLRQHQISHTDEKPLNCTICGKAFARQAYLRNHMLVHLNHKPFACGICGRAFARKPDLKTHEMMHAGLRPHSCTFCPKTFIQRCDLKRHLMVHTGERPYQCPICLKHFSQTVSLQRHKLRHAKPEHIDCGTCEVQCKQEPQSDMEESEGEAEFKVVSANDAESLNNSDLEVVGGQQSPMLVTGSVAESSKSGVVVTEGDHGSPETKEGNVGDKGNIAHYVGIHSDGESIHSVEKNLENNSEIAVKEGNVGDKRNIAHYVGTRSDGEGIHSVEKSSENNSDISVIQRQQYYLEGTGKGQDTSGRSKESGTFEASSKNNEQAPGIKEDPEGIENYLRTLQVMRKTLVDKERKPCNDRSKETEPSVVTL